MLGILPTGHRPKGEPDTSDPLVTMFWSLHKDQLGQWEKTELTDWKSTVRTLTPTIDPILEQISQKSQLTFATYWDVRMSSYHNRKFNNVVYIGDAAHAMYAYRGLMQHPHAHSALFTIKGLLYLDKV
jgi:2-polyprenyl-6-methoxyphenol hydroxylase-like FAD-dependent oxidoreductase